MAIGLLFFLSVLGMIAGLLTTKDYKRLSRTLFSLSLVLLVAGGLLFSVEKSQDSAVVSAFKAGGVLSCQQAGRSHEVSREAGWQLHSGDHFIRNDTIVRAGNCEAKD
jgi:hypothetical protein